MIGKDDIFGIPIESRELKKLQIPRKRVIQILSNFKYKLLL